MMENSLRHVAPSKMADLEDDLEKRAEMEYIAATKTESSNEHHHLHRAESGDC